MKDSEVKELLIEILNETNELCSLCEKMGQNLPMCQCMKNKDCAVHIMKMFKEKRKNRT